MKITFTNFNIPSANIGKDNMLADIKNNKYLQTKILLSENITEKEKEYIGKGMISTILPYMHQEDYDRSRILKEYKCAILENEYLKAIFVTELGGRLWSLYDKKNNNELLYKNEVFQPANLALRNAWFSGGIEWNVGIRGHNPLTISPLFAQKVYSKDGNEILKMYEYERIRGIVYCIYATLKDDVLVVKVRIENNNDYKVPMYWWTNMALLNDKNLRIISPASETFYCSSKNGGYYLDKTKLPYFNGVDLTYPDNLINSRDFFFDIPKEVNKWECGINESGYGLIEFSTNNLIGRKMFIWGNSQGGNHWNNWLSDTNKNYIEIQAGLLKTQLEHFPMEANSEISFIECFGPIKLSKGKINGKYVDAVKCIGDIVKEKQNFLDDNIFNIVKEDEIKYYGSGWGALQNLISNKKISKYCEFPNKSLDSEQEDWINLINGKSLSCDDKFNYIPSYVIGDYWEKAIEKTFVGNWYEYYQLGIIKCAKSEYDNALNLFKKSLNAKENAWAYRNIAQIEGNIFGNYENAARIMEKAIKLQKEYIPIIIETAIALMHNGEYKKWIERYNALPESIKNHGRLKLLTGACYVYINDLDNAQKFINKELIVYDIREGEFALSEIWYELHLRVIANEKNIDIKSINKEEVFKIYPIPCELDFRTHLYDD